MNSRDNAPTVSVVLSVRNGGTDLPQALGTILNQSFTDFELIAINNGSTDGTHEFLNQVTDPRVRVYHQENKGLAAQRSVKVRLTASRQPAHLRSRVASSICGRKRRAQRQRSAKVAGSGQSPAAYPAR